MARLALERGASINQLKNKVMQKEIKKVVPFKFNEHLFMPYPQRRPKDFTPIKVLTTKNEIKYVVQVDTGFGREFINETEHIFLFPEDIKGFWYV